VPIHHWDYGAWGPQTMIGCMRYSWSVWPGRFAETGRVFLLRLSDGVRRRSTDRSTLPVRSPGSCEPRAIRNGPNPTWERTPSARVFRSRRFN
jgi:hypothetical protein